MKTRNPVEKELNEILNRVGKAFGYASNENVREDFPQLYSDENLRHLWVAAENEVIHAHAGYFPAEMKVEGLSLPVAGIGGVYTAEDQQGKGLASDLISKCCEEARANGAALAFLWSDLHQFYEKLDFHLVGRQWNLSLKIEMVEKFFQESGRLGLEGALGFSYRERGLKFMQQSWAMNDSLPLGIRRSFEEHQIYLSSPSVNVISVWDGEVLKAYFLIGKGRDLQNYIHEWAGEPAALFFLAGKTLEWCEHDLSLLSPQYMPEENEWPYQLDALGVPMTAEYLALVKLLDLRKLEILVKHYLSQRKFDADGFALKDGGSGELEIHWQGKLYRKCDARGILQFLFGPEIPDQVDLRAFFPMRIWYWGMDSV